MEEDRTSSYDYNDDSLHDPDYEPDVSCESITNSDSDFDSAKIDTLGKQIHKFITLLFLAGLEAVRVLHAHSRFLLT